jgi:hypothetical protein
MLRYFLSCSTLTNKRQDFRKKKKVTEFKMYILIVSANFEIFLILRRIPRNIFINVKMFSCKVPVIVNLMNLEFL